MTTAQTCPPAPRVRERPPSGSTALSLGSLSSSVLMSSGPIGPARTNVQDARFRRYGPWQLEAGEGTRTQPRGSVGRVKTQSALVASVTRRPERGTLESRAPQALLSKKRPTYQHTLVRTHLPSTETQGGKKGTITHLQSHRNTDVGHHLGQSADWGRMGEDLNVPV